MNLREAIDLRAALFAAIVYYGKYTNFTIANDHFLALKWMEISNNISYLKTESCAFHHNDLAAFVKINEEKGDLIAMFDQSIHRILCNHSFLKILAVNRSMRESTEQRIYVALILQKFDESFERSRKLLECENLSNATI
jgi:hypothetical protein